MSNRDADLTEIEADLEALLAKVRRLIEGTAPAKDDVPTSPRAAVKWVLREAGTGMRSCAVDRRLRGLGQSYGEGRIATAMCRMAEDGPHVLVRLRRGVYCLPEHAPAP